MLRIKGTIGQWPVDLSLELDASDWAQLGAQLQQAQRAEPAPVPAQGPGASRPPSQDDALWQTACELVRQGGPISGPELLGQLEGLAGSTAAGKRLLVRLRHSSAISVKNGADSPLYSWKD